MPSRDEPPTRTQSRPAIDPAPSSASPLVPSPGERIAHRGEDQPVTQDAFRSIMSAVERAGDWEVSDEIEVRAIAGDVTLDFTEAELPPSGMVDIDAWTLCGHIRIVVPVGAEVELEGTPIIGSIEQKAREPSAPVPPPAHGEPPFFRIDAHAILGAIEVIAG